MSNKEAITDEIKAKIGFPLIVKPVNLGSSVGITKVKTENELDEAIMFDKVRESVVVDSGRLFNQLLHWKIAQQFRINLNKNDLDWFSACDGIIPTIEQKLTSLNEGAAAFG